MAYDIIAGKNGISRSYYLSRKKALEAFPTLKKDSLKGAIVYFDGINLDNHLINIRCSQRFKDECSDCIKCNR